MLDLNALNVFLAAAETMNFSEAGRRLNLSQPAVSMQIQGLEAQLGAALFHRAGRHIALSEAGEALIPLARDLLHHARQVEEVLLSLQGQIHGLLRLGCSTTSGKYVLPRLVARLHQRHPHVQVICDVQGREVVLRKLLAGQVQIAISSLNEPHKDIEYRPFLNDPVILIAPSDHRWVRSGGVIQPEDLLDEHFILREEGAGTREAVEQGLAWHGLHIEDLDTIMVLGNSEAIRMSVQEGMGVAFVSSMVAAEAIASGLLARVIVTGLELRHTLYLARHNGRPATGAQTAFWDLAFSPENEDIRHLPEQFDHQLLGGPNAAHP